MIHEITRTLTPREFLAASQIAHSNDRSSLILRVPMAPERAIEFRPAGKDGLVNVNLHADDDNVMDQLLKQQTFLGTFTLNFLGAEFCLHVRKADEQTPLKRPRAPSKRAAPSKNGKATSAPPSPQERAARSVEYARLGAEACPNCHSTKITKSVLVAKRCQTRCEGCGACWVEVVAFIAIESFHLDGNCDELTEGGGPSKSTSKSKKPT